MKIEMYTIKNCSNCKKAKEWLNKKGIPFKEVDMSIGGVTEVQQKKKWFKEIGLKTYHVILIDNKKTLQGFDEEEFRKAFE